MAVAERASLARHEELRNENLTRSRTKPTVTIVDDRHHHGRDRTRDPGNVQDDVDERAKKIEALERKLERLQGLVDGLKREVTERALEDAGAGSMDPVCNTCLNRKKGAALFPCGHTFCWKCTSDLRRGKGPCPVCDHYFWNVLSVDTDLLHN